MNVIFIYILTFYLNLLKILIKKANHVLSNSFLKEKKKKKKKKRYSQVCLHHVIKKLYVPRSRKRSQSLRSVLIVVSEIGII